LNLADLKMIRNFNRTVSHLILRQDT
jgi:hypothetical protein